MEHNLEVTAAWIIDLGPEACRAIRFAIAPNCRQ